MLRLTLKFDSPIPVEAEMVAPDRLADLSAAIIGRLPVAHGNATVPLGDVFHIAGSAMDGVVEVVGDCSRVKSLGAGMRKGRLSIFGNAGMHTGAGMVGGEIEVHGDAADWLGAEMRGGRIRVRGQAGDRVGVPYAGGQKGMRGGTILIDGSAGDEVGASMRRGLIAIGGSCGDFAGASMIAGSIFVFGPCGAWAGAGMRRGTIARFGGGAALPPTFRPACTFEPAFLGLYLAALRLWGFAAPAGLEFRTVCRYSGDALALGKGEILDLA